MAEVHYFTKEGLEKLKNELHNLKTVERKKVTQAILMQEIKEIYQKMQNTMQRRKLKD